VVLKDRVYLKERREKIERGARLEKKKVQGAFGQTAIPYLPIRTEEREGSTERAGRQGCSPAVRCTATPGRWGKTERRLRGSQPRAHLGLWLLVGAAPQAGADWRWRRLGAAALWCSGRRGARLWRCGLSRGAADPYL
jgi:hypothetical protein